MITFVGNVSAQEVAGELVSIIITKPDGSETKVQTNTLDDMTFTADFSDIAGIGYTAFAHIDEDNLFLAADSAVVTFDIGKESRTINLSIK